MVEWETSKQQGSGSSPKPRVLGVEIFSKSMLKSTQNM